MKSRIVEIFEQKNQKNVKILSSLHDFIVRGKSLGVDTVSNEDAKINSALNLLKENQKLRVALVGGFSEGKTTIAAGWLERYDKNSMKISQAESSDDVVSYVLDDKIEIVDTPGLFGFKEKCTDEGKVEKYRKITEKYVSESHLLLYVMDPINPIKDSHREELIWLFRTLNLLPRTIFVLSRFDEVADVEDEDSYQESLRIKRENVVGRIGMMINLSSEEQKNMEIVAVSANPFGMGLEYWLNNKEEYNKLSHLFALRKATERSISKNGEYDLIIYEAQRSIIADILGKQLPQAKKQAEEINEAVLALEQNAQKFDARISKLRGDIVSAKANLNDYLIREFKDTILQIDGLGLENIEQFVITELGRDGEVFQTKIFNAYEREISSVSISLAQIAVEFNGTVKHFDNTVAEIAKHGLDFLNKNNYITKENVIMLRDSFVKVGKAVNVDLSKILKFKPWGFEKLTRFLKWLGPALKIAIMLWEEWKKKEAEEKLQECKNEIISTLENMRKGLLEDLSDDGKFVKKFFQQYIELQNAAEEIQKEIAIYKQKQREFNDWCASGEAIEAEFKKCCSEQF